MKDIKQRVLDDFNKKLKEQKKNGGFLDDFYGRFAFIAMTVRAMPWRSASALPKLRDLIILPLQMSNKA